MAEGEGDQVVVSGVIYELGGADDKYLEGANSTTYQEEADHIQNEHNHTDEETTMDAYFQCYCSHRQSK